VGRLLPLAGVEIFARRDGRWHRPGESLPAFEVPIGDGSAGSLLDRLVLPEPLVASRPDGEPPRPVHLRLVRDSGDLPQSATAMRCRLADLASWAERAPSSWIESLSAAWSDPSGGCADGADVLVLGASDPVARTDPGRPLWDSLARTGARPPGRVRLPALGEGLRFRGCDVMIPLGYRAEPDLADRALRQAVGAEPDDLVVLDDEGAELVPRQAFRPLSRAGIRLAVAAKRPGPSTS
jgi:hypothetical protein